MVDSDARLPEIAVLVNGTPLLGVVELEICSNSFMGADRYRLAVSLEASGYDVWTANDIDLTISLGLSGDWQTLIVGPVDRLDVDLSTGLVHLDGRDLTARFIEARIQETFENQTSSEIATFLALRRGLSANVQPTTSLVGRDFGGSHARTALDQYSGITTEWDLLAKLADFENFDVWVDGQTLNFAPSTLSSTPLVLSPQACEGIRLQRYLPLCGNLQVAVRSWDCRGQQAISQIAGSVDGSGSRSYVLVRPNLTEAAAIDLASRTLSQIAQNARSISLELPGDVTIRPRQTLVMTDTGTDFDGAYVITNIERRLSFDHGFTQFIQARTPPWTTFSTV